MSEARRMRRKIKRAVEKQTKSFKALVNSMARETKTEKEYEANAEHQ